MPGGRDKKVPLKKIVSFPIFQNHSLPLSLLGYLKPPPPFKIPCLMSIRTNDTPLESSDALLCKIFYLFAKSSYKVKLLAKKIIMIKYTFLKTTSPCNFKYGKILQNFKQPDVSLRKTKMGKFLLTGFMQIICKNFFENLWNPLPYAIGFPKS